MSSVWAVVIEARPVATLPLVAGASATLPGQRARVESWERSPGDVALRVETKVIADTRLAGLWPGRFDDSMGCVLVNEARGEGLVLARGGMSGGMDALVLPGVSLSSMGKQCAWAPQLVGNRGAPQLADIVPDPAWFDGARLVLVSHEVVGSFPFRIEAEAPPPEAPPPGTLEAGRPSAGSPSSARVMIATPRPDR
ncbi:MAG TPA: hypothetical protein VGE02_08845 [Gemmatimonadales bacterium]